MMKRYTPRKPWDSLTLRFDQEYAHAINLCLDALHHTNFTLIEQLGIISAVENLLLHEQDDEEG